ncbi:MAG TPA: DMT family transporter [Hypericibacter adhaerens]|jgi:drug/metabolite transporter (DMT)-like permease|uniref:DMT family transporter n=1 Tax=Hypericibacter adhaerens TaxID=2602016 RepID=UPI002BA83F04|nr:DMT family transporter [Hypericibacter adhaerens]HWA44976.1 DMT family transporter [Hypericibacter adhaerens]
MAAPSSTGESGSVLSGIGLALSAYFTFSLQDATVKWLVADYSTPQVMFMRAAIILVIAFSINGRRLAMEALASVERKALAWRALALLAAWLCYYTASRDLQLAEMSTIYFSSPLIVAALAAPILGEKVTRFRWFAIGIGFVGVVVACRPTNMHQPVAIGLALTAALLWAYAMILFRQVAPRIRTWVQMVITNSTFVVVCGVSLPWAWKTPTLHDFLLMLLLGCMGCVGQYLVTEGIRRAPATVIAPLEFSTLLWAFCLGYIIWGDLPDFAVFVGAALILAGGMMVIGAEWRASRRRALERRAALG